MGVKAYSVLYAVDFTSFKAIQTVCFMILSVAVSISAFLPFLKCSKSVLFPTRATCNSSVPFPS